MLNLEIVQNPSLRYRFINRFLLSRKEYEAKQNLGAEPYEEALLWDRMPKYPRIFFREALRLLRAIDGEVLVFTEENPTPMSGLVLHGTEYKKAVARGNSREIADCIECEWFENRRLSLENASLANSVFPEDFYVVSPDFSRLIVFTHETDFWHLEQEEPVKVGMSRYCMAVGFDFPICPYTGGYVDESSCVDIQMIANGYISQSALWDVEIECEIAKEICSLCPRRMLEEKL